MKFILLIMGAFLIGSCGGADVSQTEDGFAAVKGIYSLKKSECTTNSDSTLIIQQNKALLSFEGGLNYYGRDKWSGYVVQKEDGSQKIIFTFRDPTPIAVAGGNPSQSPDQPRDPEEEKKLRERFERLVDKMECEAVIENEELQGNCQPKGDNNKKEACQFSFQRSDSEDEAKAKECLGVEDLPADISLEGTVEEEKVAFEEGQTIAQILVNDSNNNSRLDGGEGLAFFLTHEEKVTSGRSRRGIGSRRVEKPEPSLGIGMYLTKLTASAEGEGQCYSTEKDKDSLGGRVGFDLSQTNSARKFVFKNPVKIESVAFYVNSFRRGTRIRGFFKATLEEGKGELVGRFMGNSRSIRRDDIREIFGDDDEDDKKPAPK